MPQGHDPYAVLTAEIAKGTTRAERIERGKRALIEAVAVQACMDAQSKNLTNRLDAIRWLRAPQIGAGKWWIEQVLQLDYEALLEQLHIRREHK